MKNIEIIKYEEHTKASERNVLVNLKYGNEKISKLIPYYYRRTAVFKEKEKEIKEYLISIYDQLNPQKYKRWEDEQEKFWQTKKNAVVTKPVFDSLKGSKLRVMFVLCHQTQIYKEECKISKSLDIHYLQQK